MQIFKTVLFSLAFLSATSCTTILVNTTGPEGIQEDPGERTTGTLIEDRSIQTKIIVNMKSAEPAFRKTHFDVIAHNGVVLIVGQVSSERLKARATEIASQASNKIKRIHNELEVIGKTGVLARSNDAWIGTKVRAQIAADDNVPFSKVRVITENGSVFLMGMVPQDIGDSAAALARNISGVTRVVKVFEYIN